MQIHWILAIVSICLARLHANTKESIRESYDRRMRHVEIQNSASYVHSVLNQSAFCQNLDSFDQQRYFPIDVPEHHLPWIWEAVYDPVTNLVELTTMNRIPCRFKHDQWKELQRLFPEHLHQLAYGLDSNILVPVEQNITIAQEYFLTSDFVYCEYMKGSKVMHTIRSRRIRGMRPHTSFSTLQIRCPAPRSTVPNALYESDSIWDSVRLRLNPERKQYMGNIFSNLTAAVPVCKLPQYDPKDKKYKLSVCTSTGRSNREHLVEWIEYHRLMGVEHFFLYNTALEDRSKLSQTLHDYIKEGVVTVVPWHYMNCVRYMASGRWNVYRRAGSGEAVFFQSPKAIAQQNGLASCYTRFKHTSKYMAHIDDDEFLVFDGVKVKESLQLSKEPKTLVTLSDSIFAANPLASAIRFEPVLFWPCNITKGYENTKFNAIRYPSEIEDKLYQQTPLPRLGVWDLSEAYEDPYECKLIMRTDAVGMFFVHFISLIENGPWEKRDQKSSLTYPLTHLSMLHYKYPQSLARHVLDGSLPYTNESFANDCKYWKRFRHKGKDYHAKISYDTGMILKQLYSQRMRQPLPKTDQTIG